MQDALAVPVRSRLHHEGVDGTQRACKHTHDTRHTRRRRNSTDDDGNTHTQTPTQHGGGGGRPNSVPTRRHNDEPPAKRRARRHLCTQPCVHCAYILRKAFAHWASAGAHCAPIQNCFLIEKAGPPLREAWPTTLNPILPLPTSRASFLGHAAHTMLETHEPCRSLFLSTTPMPHKVPCIGGTTQWPGRRFHHVAGVSITISCDSGRTTLGVAHSRTVRYDT